VHLHSGNIPHIPEFKIAKPEFSPAADEFRTIPREFAAGHRQKYGLCGFHKKIKPGGIAGFCC
jgi:hypothetical protein